MSMAAELPLTNGHSDGHANTNGEATKSFSVKAGLARMLKGGVIMDVVNSEQVFRDPTRSPPAPVPFRLLHFLVECSSEN